MPKPRCIQHDGSLREAHYLGETWLEAEAAAYPNGGFGRRAYVRLDGKLMIVWCSIPDTFFTIPARVTINGQRVSGYITTTDSGQELEFHRNKEEPKCIKAL